MESTAKAAAMNSLFRNMTPLTAAPGLSEGEVTRLKTCGIGTWEEYCAYASANKGVKLAGSEWFRAKIGGAYESISSAVVAPRPMGCTMPDSSLARMKAMCTASFSAEGPVDPSVGDFREDGLPGEVRLMDRMPEVRNQETRGTCTAFASVALCEFAEGCAATLSPQFLYWASKKRDDAPGSEGTCLEIVQEALYEDGVCEEAFWKYNPKPLIDAFGTLDAGQGPAPAAAVENARRHRFTCKALMANSVRQYRKVLASGLPVVVGVACFDSWTRNKMTEETGRVPMPYIRRNEHGQWQLMEDPKGGHAMCLVGYVDDPAVCGGGYFIVRNSWGNRWAYGCKEGAGHALMPYSYIALFTFSAFTLLGKGAGENGEGGRRTERDPQDSPEATMRRVSPLDALPANLRPYARVLEGEARDFRGSLLPKGACALSLPKPGSPLVEYKPGNFGTREYRAILTASRFPDRAHWAQDMAEGYEDVLRRKQAFCARIDENFSPGSLRFMPFPDRKPSCGFLQLMGERRIVASSEVADFSSSLFDVLLEDAMPPDEGLADQIPDAWRKEMRATVSAKIRKVTGLSFIPASVYVVEAFATPFGMDANTGVCRFARPTARLVDAVKACAFTVLGKKAKGKYVFFSIGTGMPLDPAVEAGRDGSSAVAICGAAADGRWDVRMPGYPNGFSSHRDFCDRLMPVTREEVKTAVKSYVDSVARDTFKSGKVTVSEVIEHLHETPDGKYREFPAFRQAAVVNSLLAMQSGDPGRYAVCRETSGSREVFVIPRTEIQKGDKPFKRRGWLGNLVLTHSVQFLGLVVSAIIIVCKSELEARFGLGHSIVVRIVLAAATMFVCGVIQNCFNRMVTSVERD